MEKESQPSLKNEFIFQPTLEGETIMLHPLRVEDRSNTSERSTDS